MVNSVVPCGHLLQGKYIRSREEAGSHSRPSGSVLTSAKCASKGPADFRSGVPNSVPGGPQPCRV